jgi:putative SbcD/Mre11-related phosphoesterase
MKFITDEPALQIGDTIVIADIHMGIEHEFYKSGIKLPSQMPKVLEKIKRIVKATSARKLIILGDVKHKVPGMSFQEMREIPEFFQQLAGIIKTEVVIGNHDAGLKKLAGQVRFHSSRGFLLGDAYLMHGHTYPDKPFLLAKWVVMAHNHPLIEFRDSMGYRWNERVWVKANFRKQELDGLKKKLKLKELPKNMPEVIVMPAFSEFAGGRSITGQENFMGPLAKFLDYSRSKIYLLDGTYLGRLVELRQKGK